MALYKFASEPDDSLNCIICLEVAVSNPVCHETCGKLFCEGCIEKYGRNNPCPNCRRENVTFTPDTKSKSRNWLKLAKS